MAPPFNVLWMIVLINRIVLCCIGIALLTAPAASAQTAPPGDTVRPARSLAASAPAPADSLDDGRITPRGAFLRSLILPGWGQSEIGAPGRGSVYFALEVGSLWMVYKSSQKLDEARLRERVLHDTGELPRDRRTGLVRDRKAQVEDWVTLSLFWLLFSGADAYVSAHLRDFDAHVGVIPTPEGGAQLQLTVPTGRRP